LVKCEQTNHQGIHTNNYTESWYWLLKNSYLPTSDQLRIDEVVQILTDNVESHYQWSQNQVKSGFARQTSKKFQMRQKLIADAFTPDNMDMLGISGTVVTGGVSLSLLTNLNGTRTDLCFLCAVPNLCVLKPKCQAAHCEDMHLEVNRQGATSQL
jgi:hypothetical protein